MGLGSPRSAHGRRGGVHVERDLDGGGGSGEDDDGAEARGVLLCLYGCSDRMITERMQSIYAPLAGLRG